MTTIVQIEKQEATPLNAPPTGSYSFKNGNPIVQFQIASQDKFLDGKTLRLNGVLRLNAVDSTEALPVHPENVTGAAAVNGIALNGRIGVAACIQQITLATSTNQTLEVIRSYGRYLASVVASTHSPSDLDTVVSLGNPVCASRDIVGAKHGNVDVSFSIPLRTGLLQSGDLLPLGTNGLRGLMINLELAPDSMALSGYKTYDDAGAATQQLYSPISTGAFYQLRDLTLTYDLMIPDEMGQGKMSSPASGAFAYNSISHLYSVLNSSDQTLNFNLGTSNTLSVFHNFVPTSHVNTYAHDSFETSKLKNAAGAALTKRVSFLRGGSKFPFDYDIDVEDESAQDVIETDVDIKMIDSIKPFDKFNHALISTWTQDGIPMAVDLSDDPKSVRPTTLVEAKPVYGFGVNLDPVSRVGLNFKNTTYGLRVQSTLDGVSPNSVYTYVLAKNVLSYSPSGIVVSS